MINTLDHLIVAVKDLDEAERNYQKVFGVNPVWKGEHKELGTANSIFNFKNTYFELLSAKGEGLGAALVNDAIEKKGEGLTGIVFGTENIDKVTRVLKDNGYMMNDPLLGEGTNSNNQSIRKWKNLFLPPELTRGLFSFIIEHTEGKLPSIDSYPDTAFNKLDHIVINTNDAEKKHDDLIVISYYICLLIGLALLLGFQVSQ